MEGETAGRDADGAVVFRGRRRGRGGGEEQRVSTEEGNSVELE